MDDGVVANAADMDIMDGVEDVRIRPLDSVDRLRDVERLQVEVWGMSDREVVPYHQLLAAVRNGGLVLGAFAAEELVGFCYGFPGVRDGEPVFCSHMTGVLPAWQTHDVGYRLKCAQREWAIAQGYSRMVWTYDPLQSLNAYFNLHKLGAEARRYYVDYYGEMDDELNRGLPSDRIEVDWWLRAPEVVRRLAGRRVARQTADAAPVLQAEGWRPGEVGEPGAAVVRIEIPRALRALRDQDPDAALAWRLATRQAFQRCFQRGYVAVDFVPSRQSGFYILQQG
ncbi:MAG: GNAT family N-acetyltransferase [Armatimonadota bacterium]|nr:GNAT family N-acetyltransferase [Armatimonadota bacterium]MDR5696184.1 GNAT family N-acetyltransferase [Armatimonadota bacterium]